jgi:hypothetical protein
MKIIVTNTRTIDLNEERKRIRKLFRNPLYRDALINVIDVFEKDGFEKAWDVYFDLPYNKEDEYPLQESMGKWWSQVSESWFLHEKNVKHEQKIEIINE